MSPHRFREHLDILAATATVLPLPDLLRCVRSGRAPRRGVVITFDDGYADNFIAARPLLVVRAVPATFFVQTGILDSPRGFWWDELAALILTRGRVGERLQLELNGTSFTWHLDAKEWAGSADNACGTNSWRAWEPPPTACHAAFLDIWRRLRDLTERERRSALDSLAEVGRGGMPPSSPRPMAWHEVRELARDSVVTIGAHTVTHSRLAALSEPEQRLELATSRSQLEEVVARPVCTMSYPFGHPGDYTSATIALAREAGFSCACTSVPGVVDGRSDPFQLPRHAVPDVDAVAFERWLEDLWGVA